jgi:tetratricopeptide (TPR) repeat protein
MEQNFPDSIAPFNKSAQDFEKKGKYDEAIAIYRKALAQYPDLAGLHNNLGCCLANKYEYKQAAEEFQKAIDLTPINRQNGIVTPDSYPEEPIQNLRAVQELDKGYLRTTSPARVQFEDYSVHTPVLFHPGMGFPSYLLHSFLHMDAYTCGQISGFIGWIILVLFAFLGIDWIVSITGWLGPFFVISIFLLLHAISMGISVIVRPMKLDSISNSGYKAFLAWDGPLKVNIIDHLLASLSSGIFFLFATALFLKLLYLLSGGFLHATSNYWDWLLFVLYLVIDQICFGLISTFLSIFHVTFLAIQATQPWQQLAVYVPGVVFALLFWSAFLKFLKMLRNKGTPKISAHPEDQILRPSVVFEVLISPCIVSGFGLILIQGIEWLVSFTGRAEVGLLISVAVSFFIIRFAVFLFRIPPEKFVSIFALHFTFRPPC